MPGRLIVRPPHGPQRDVALDGDVVRIGRSSDCDVVLDLTYVSRIHARIEREGAAYVLVDNRSTNGTFVNGKRMENRHVLTSGDHIAIADASITFLDSPSADEARTLAMPNDCPIRCDPTTREAWIDDEKISARLSAQEFQLLLLLSTNYGRVSARDELAMAIWGADNYDYNMLHRLVHRLKQKLGEHHDLLHTVPGVGYVVSVGAEA